VSAIQIRETLVTLGDVQAAADLDAFVSRHARLVERVLAAEEALRLSADHPCLNGHAVERTQRDCPCFSCRARAVLAASVPT